MLQSTRLQRVRHDFTTEQPQPYILNRPPWWLNGKEPTCKCRRCGFDPWFRKIPWRSKWKPTTVFLPGKSHGKRSLAGYNPWGHKRVGHKSATKHTHTSYIILQELLVSVDWENVDVQNLCLFLGLYNLLSHFFILKPQLKPVYIMTYWRS